jgi:glycosyltransferase involved in cell wall biosynthesis
LVTREAAQAGLWVIASDRGAIGDIVVNDRNGFRIDVSDGSELEQVLIAIDQAPERYRVRTNYPLQLRTFDDQVDELVDIYRSIGPRSPDKTNGKAEIAPALLSDLPASVRPAAAGATTLGAS